ncbi:MAG: hypothetical protein C5B49_15015 [Bdellovibrio sp.]|nr:MAG: hypothetical protein C5B49_15015 [Bdellovibrio sp.]
MKNVFLTLCVTLSISSFSWGYDYTKPYTSPTGKEEILKIDTCQISDGYNNLYNISVPVVTINYEACAQTMTQEYGYTKRSYWADKSEAIPGTEKYSAEIRRDKKTFEVDAFDLNRILGNSPDLSKVNTRDFSKNLMTLVQIVSKRCSDFVWSARQEMSRNQGRCESGNK